MFVSQMLVVVLHRASRKEVLILEPIRLCVVGIGGVGSWLSDGLARMLEYKAPGSTLILIDGDHYEEKNRERQDFETMGNKAEAKAADLVHNFPQTLIAGLGAWIVADPPQKPDEGETARFVAPRDLFQEGDIIFATVDNFAARALIFEAAKAYDNIDVFTGGNDDALFGSIYHYSRRDGVNVTLNPVDFKPELQSPPDRNPGELSCQERAMLEGGTQLIATNMAVSAFLLGRFQTTILDGRAPVETEIMFDLGAGLAQNYNWSSVTEKVG